MTIPAPLHLKDWFDQGLKPFLLLAPTSTSPQPVHVLNGLFHNSLSGRRAPRVAVDLVATKDGRWARTPAQVREKTSLTLPRDDHDLQRVRRAAAGMIATDRAVYTSNASFQTAHLGLVTSDSTHFDLGLLAAKLLLMDEEGRQLLEQAVHRLSLPQPNPYWALESVLSEAAVTTGLVVEPPQTGPSWIDDPRCETLASDLGGVLRRSLSLLAGRCDTLLALQTLASAATWTGLVAFAQVSSLLAREKQQVILCEAGAPGALPSLRTSAASALDAVNGSFEELLRLRLTAEVVDRFSGREPSPEEAHEFLQTCKPYALSGGSSKTFERLPENFDLWRQSGLPVFDSIAYTLQTGLIAAMGDKPRKWFSAVGRHCGFVGPRRGQVPRFRVEVSLIPTLVLAGISDGDGESVRYSTWLDRLSSRFGVFFGPRAETRAMVPRATEDDLEQNTSDLASLLASLGLARRYSDGVTEVLNPLHLWQVKE